MGFKNKLWLLFITSLALSLSQKNKLLRHCKDNCCTEWCYEERNWEVDTGSFNKRFVNPVNTYIYIYCSVHFPSVCFVLFWYKAWVLLHPFIFRSVASWFIELKTWFIWLPLLPNLKTLCSIDSFILNSLPSVWNPLFLFYLCWDIGTLMIL